MSERNETEKFLDEWSVNLVVRGLYCGFMAACNLLETEVEGGEPVADELREAWHSIPEERMRDQMQFVIFGQRDLEQDLEGM